MNLNSDQLKIIQSALDEKMKREIKKPDCDYKHVAVMADITAIIDNHRRKVWHDEKFGDYDEIASEIVGKNDTAFFTSDEIPF